MQFISVGNIATNNKVALFFMDYAAKTRLKIFAEAELVELKDNPILLKNLNLPTYEFRAERMIVLDVKAFSWNCPQHITPRYDLDEISEAFSSQQDRIIRLETELKILRASPKQ
jgi:hypothetical protein